MEKNIAIIGGDERIAYLRKMMRVDYNVVNEIDEAELVIGPIPFSKDGEKVFNTLDEKIIPIEEVIKKCKGRTLIAGAISDKVCDLAKENDVEVVDLMKNESLAVLNTIATAEGTVEVAMRRTKRTIHGSNVLILGFGRVAKVVAQKFAGLSASITCAARKQEAFAWIEACGYKHTNVHELGENLMEYDIIINTPPTLILDMERLKYVKKDSLIIDLASKPGGVDRETVAKLGINFEWALALPGKVAPITSAEYIKMTIEEVFE